MASELANYLGRIQELHSQISGVIAELPTQGERPRLPVRWSILHLIDHTALHLGHLQVTCQLWSGGKIIPSPLWLERLPPNQDF